MTPPSKDSHAETHKRTYSTFMRLVGYAVGGVALVLILLAIFLL